MKRLPEQLLIALGFTADSKAVPLPGNENENYLVSNNRKSFVVKKLQGHSAANTELEGAYRLHLAEAGLPVAPYTLLGGDSYVLTLGKVNYVATSYQNGTMATLNKQTVTAAAALLAKVHSFNADRLPNLQSWYRKSYIPDSLDVIDDRYAGAKKAFAMQHAGTPDFWSGDLPKGIIHGDLHADNIIVDARGTIAGIIDWEEAAVEPLLLDVAHSAQQLSFKQGACNEELFNAFIAAYQEVRPLTQLEKQLFNKALQYTMLVLSVWAHIKMSRGEMADDLFQRVGNYYKTTPTVPCIS